MRQLVGSRWMELPRIVAVGSGVILELPEICSRPAAQEAGSYHHRPAYPGCGGKSHL
ncbi:MAG: hypothetical protein MZV63_33405 [Marinilabiliales bacterium]|nr:hypothetical protein [Marinilabiliales bacterium]